MNEKEKKKDSTTRHEPCHNLHHTSPKAPWDETHRTNIPVVLVGANCPPSKIVKQPTLAELRIWAVLTVLCGASTSRHLVCVSHHDCNNFFSPVQDSGNLGLDLQPPCAVLNAWTRELCRSEACCMCTEASRFGEATPILDS